MTHRRCYFAALIFAVSCCAASLEAQAPNDAADVARLVEILNLHEGSVVADIGAGAGPLTVGISPHRYLSRLRLETAMIEIATGKLPLAQIALNAGFSSQASFTRAFGRAMGVTPGEYRRNTR